MEDKRIITLKNWQENEFSMYSELEDSQEENSACSEQFLLQKNFLKKYLGKIKGLTNDNGNYACICDRYLECLSGPPMGKLELVKSIEDFNEDSHKATYLLARDYAQNYAKKVGLEFMDCTQVPDTTEEKDELSILEKQLLGKGD